MRKRILLFSMFCALFAFTANAQEQAEVDSAFMSIDGVIDNSLIADENDLSGKFKINWDADSLYVYVEVLDDVLYGDHGTVYMNDNICVYIDLHNQKTDSYADSTQLYWEINWYDDGIGGRRGTAWGASAELGTIFKTIDEGTGYNINVSVAWGDIESGFTPSVGDSIGFDIKLSDNDGDGRMQMAWMDITDGGWNDPSLFGTIILAEDEKVEYPWIRPVAPRLTLTEADGVVTVKWTAVTGAANYDVYRGNTKLGNTEDCELTDDGIEKSGKFTYKVVALDADEVALNQSLKIIEVEIEEETETLINTIDSKSTLSIYPNPATTEISISGVDVQYVEIYNINGSLVNRLSGVSTIDVSGYSNGVYIVKVRSNDNVYTGRFIKK